MALLTKVQQVNRYLQRSIYNGKWAPGEKIPSERDLCTRLNASHQVVREAMIQLANEGLVSRKQGSGTYVAEQVKKATIGILVNVNHITSLNGYFFQRLIAEFKMKIEAAGLRTMLFVAHNQDRETLSSDIHLFDKGVVEQVAGVISLINLSHMEERLNQEGICAVSLLHAFSKYSVIYDYESMLQQGVQLLYDCGYHEFTLMHVNFAQVSYDNAIYGRINQLLENIRAHDHANLVGISMSLSCEYAYEAFKQLWAGPKRPRAIFFLDDGICDMATRAVLELGIKVPEDLAILTMSNIGRKFTFPVPLTTISFDPGQSVEKAWSMLSHLIDGKKVEPAMVSILPSVMKGLSLGEGE
jgi:GntR family transcriptional regulator of arabinose operon